MFYDLNIPWTIDTIQLQKTLAFSEELGYNVVALSHTIVGKLPVDLVRSLLPDAIYTGQERLTSLANDDQTCPIPKPLPFRVSPKLRILRRCTLVLADPSENHRLSSLSTHYDLIAIRPTTERALQHACHNADVPLISLDLTQRYPFHFRRSLLHPAIARGLRFELCYAPGIVATDATARRNVIANATQLVRTTKGKGVVISSEARSALGLRGPIDLVNLAAVWGLSSDKGRVAVEREARLVVVTADMKQTCWRGVIDVIDGGEPPPPAKSAGVKIQDQTASSGKRKAETSISKRQAKKARKAAAMQMLADEESLEPDKTKTTEVVDLSSTGA